MLFWIIFFYKIQSSSQFLSFYVLKILVLVSVDIDVSSDKREFLYFVFCFLTNFK